MIIDCPYCKSRVDAKVHGEREVYNPREDPLPSKVAVLSCPSCDQTLVGQSEKVQRTQWDEPEWEMATRLWPDPNRRLAWHLPQIVKTSLEEADRCFQAGAYSACAVMCGRALEGVCVHHKTRSKTLHVGLKELLDADVIDKRLYQWGDELRKVRNLGAHASDEKVPLEDARDVLDFVHAISDYVFVLNKKFDDFMSRRSSPGHRKTPPDGTF